MAENTHLFKLLLYVLLGCAGLCAFVLSRDRLRNGFFLFICTLGLGYRTFALTPKLRIIPAELVLCALVVLALGRSSTPAGGPRTIRPPWWVLVLLPFWGLAWLTGSETGFPWDARLAEFCNFIVLVPLGFVTPVILCAGENGGRWSWLYWA